MIDQRALSTWDCAQRGHVPADDGGCLVCGEQPNCRCGQPMFAATVPGKQMVWPTGSCPSCVASQQRRQTTYATVATTNANSDQLGETS